jgi:hypothetical protein
MAVSAKSSKTAVKGTTVHFDFEKETPGTQRYKERGDDDTPVVVGTLYLKKDAAEALDNPESLTVTIKAGG